MDRDELRKIFREEGNSTLKSIPSDFYSKAAEYVRELEEEIRKINNPRSVESKMLEDELQSAITDIEYIFIRRMRKITTRATSNAFSSSSSKQDLDKLLPQEQHVYNETLQAINSTRNELLEPILNPDSFGLVDPEDSSKKDTKEAACINDEQNDRSGKSEPVHPVEDRTPITSDTEKEISKSNINKEYDVVRILKDIPKFLAVDNRTYQLKAEDIAGLPSLNAKALVKRGAANLIPDNRKKS